MILLPAIDLMEGKVVRLQRGEAETRKVYSNDPVAFALRWEKEGGDYLHVVDLDAAFAGEPRNLPVIREMASALSIPIELGGGIRSLKHARQAIEAGVSRIIIGTKAVESIQFLRHLVDELGGTRVAVGIDAKNGMVAVKGWTETSGITATDLARRVEDTGVSTIIYTDIATDGMLQGPNIPEVKTMLAAVDCQIISSGGVASDSDLECLASLDDLYGAIIGKALYEGHILLPQVRHLGGRIPAKFLTPP